MNSSKECLLIQFSVPSAVSLHLLPDPELNEATEEMTEQNNKSEPPVASENVSLSNHRQPFHLGCTSPFKNHTPSFDEIKQKAQEIKRKLNLTKE